jgi:hypothetical protein
MSSLSWHLVKIGDDRRYALQMRAPEKKPAPSLLLTLLHRPYTRIFSLRSHAADVAACHTLPRPDTIPRHPLTPCSRHRQSAFCSFLTGRRGNKRQASPTAWLVSPLALSPTLLPLSLPPPPRPSLLHQREILFRSLACVISIAQLASIRHQGL